MHSISPFSIPLIVDLICDYIGSDDIVNCKKVCKDWLDLFARNEWRSLHVKDPTSTTLSFVREKANRLQSLTIELNDSCEGFHNVLELVRQNPKLRSFQILSERDTSELYISAFISSLLELLCLTSLTLTLLRHINAPYGEHDGSPLHFELMSTSLANCLPNLESLNITLSGHEYCDVDYSDPYGPPQIDTSTLIRSCKPLAIRKFHFNAAWGLELMALNQIGLIPFLKHCCPLIEDLSLPTFPEESCEELMKTIGGHCPELRHLRLDNDNFYGSPEGMKYITQPLKFLKIDLAYHHDSVVLDVLWKNGPDALETLEFMNTEYYYNEYAPPYNWFPSLTRVDYHKTHRGGGEPEVWTRPLDATSDDKSVREFYNSMASIPSGAIVLL
ncbi:hypothetical protein BGX26_010861 [Mortierella sp. AD094]|nr:hypothetical protein BGX26_010861 [Mortierella sp. AD094]